MKYITFVVVCGAVIAGVLWLSERRTDALQAVAECVDKRATEEQYMGTLQQAWETFAPGCAGQE